MNRKTIVTLFLAFVLLGATALTEYLFYRQDENVWVERFEDRLHGKEAVADETLRSFCDSINIGCEDWNEDIIYLGFRRGKLFFWSDELITGKDFYGQLTEKGNFVKIGNTFFDVRSKKHKDFDFFALLDRKSVV